MRRLMKNEIGADTSFAALVQIANIALDNRGSRGRSPSRITDVEGDDAFAASEKRFDEVRADKTRCAGDEPSAHLPEVTALTQA